MKKEKYCLYCEKKLIKRSQYKFCNATCQNTLNYESYIERWKQGLETGLIAIYCISKHVQRYIKEKYNNKCAICGWSEINKTSNKIPLEIDHVNGDWKNCTEENLILLCPNCHSLTPSYKGANKGKGRKKQKKI